LNSGGALAGFTWAHDRECDLAIRDGGDFLAYSRVAPARVDVDGEPAAFHHDAADGSLRVELQPGRHAMRVRW
jgi:hypothetical protein